jgi:hypothetical protein
MLEAKSNVTPFCLDLSSFEQFFYRLSFTELLQVLNRFPPDVIFKLATTSRTMSYTVECYVQRAWDIDAFLSVWFPHTLKFRRMLNVCHAIVGGMPALQFFDRSNMRRSTVLDIFVRFEGLYQMGRFLVHSGYAFRPHGSDRYTSWDVVAFTLSGKLRFDSRRTNPDNYFVSRQVQTYRFVRSATGNRSVDHTVRLTLLRIEPVKWILSGQTSTCVIISNIWYHLWTSYLQPQALRS